MAADSTDGSRGRTGRFHYPSTRRHNQDRIDLARRRRAPALRQAELDRELRLATGASVWLRSARRHADLSQRELARLAGVAASTVARAEARGAAVRAGTLLTLLNACGCRLVLVDEHGRVLDYPLDGMRDRGQRLYPPHLDLVSTAEHPWWGQARGWLGAREPAPDWSFRTSRDRRDRERQEGRYRREQEGDRRRERERYREGDIGP